eukprot:755013-Hanusia_phi.AAC.1
MGAELCLRQILLLLLVGTATGQSLFRSLFGFGGNENQHARQPMLSLSSTSNEFKDALDKRLFSSEFGQHGTQFSSHASHYDGFQSDRLKAKVSKLQDASDRSTTEPDDWGNIKNIMRLKDILADRKRREDDRSWIVDQDHRNSAWMSKTLARAEISAIRKKAAKDIATAKSILGNELKRQHAIAKAGAIRNEITKLDMQKKVKAAEFLAKREAALLKSEQRSASGQRGAEAYDA